MTEKNETREAEGVLLRYAELGRHIRECEREFQEECAQKEAFLDGALRPPPPDRVRVTGGGVPDPVFDAVRLMMELFDGRIRNLRARLCDLMCERDLLRARFREAGLSDLERAYVEWRYAKGISAECASEKAGVSTRHGTRLKNTALAKLAASAPGRLSGNPAACAAGAVE